MPHCSIEYSNDLEENNKIDEMVQIVHQQIIDSKVCDSKDIKTRAIPVSNYLIGGEKAPFIHTSVRLLEGRTDKVKYELSKNILRVLSEKYNLENISVEIIDIHKNSYSKI